jgi:hypothetical protein
MRERINIQLSADRNELKSVVANRNSPQKHVWRTKIVLTTADGHGHCRNHAGHWQGQNGDLALAGTVRRASGPPVQAVERSPIRGQAKKRSSASTSIRPTTPLVLSVDEKSQIQAPDRSQPGPP